MVLWDDAALVRIFEREIEPASFVTRGIGDAVYPGEAIIEEPFLGVGHGRVPDGVLFDIIGSVGAVDADGGADGDQLAVETRTVVLVLIRYIGNIGTAGEDHQA